MKMYVIHFWCAIYILTGTQYMIMNRHTYEHVSSEPFNILWGGYD